jgi:hypothetical protein
MFMNNSVTNEIISILENNSEGIVKRSGHIPKFYYIGMGKSGSTTIQNSLIGESVTHWHSASHFEAIYNTQVLTKNGLHILDVPLLLSERFKFKPTIIECVREPISRNLSRVMQDVKMGRTKDKAPFEIAELAKSDVLNGSFWPLAKNWRARFGADPFSGCLGDKSYFYQETEKAILLLLKLETSQKWQGIFDEIGIKFKLASANEMRKTKHSKFYDDAKKSYRFTKEELEKVFGQSELKAIYTEEELENFKKKYLG